MIRALTAALLILSSAAQAQTPPEVIRYREATAARQAMTANPLTRPRQILLYYPDPSAASLYSKDKWWLLVEQYGNPGNSQIEQIPLHTSGSLAEALVNAAMLGFKPTAGINYETGKVFTPVLPTIPAPSPELVADMYKRLQRKLADGKKDPAYVEPLR